MIYTAQIQHRPLYYTTNEFLNFMKVFRNYHYDIDLRKQTEAGVIAWNALSDDEKQSYRTPDDFLWGAFKPKTTPCQPVVNRCPPRKRAKPKPKKCRPKTKRCNCPKKHRPSCRRRQLSKAKKSTKCRKKRHPKCQPKRRRPPCRRKRLAKSRCGLHQRCMKPAPAIANGYLNYLRSYRRTHHGLSPRELIHQAAKDWCALSRQQQGRYNRMDL